MFGAEFLVAFIITQAAILATTVYLHRALSHKALRLSPSVDFAFRLLLWVTTGINRQDWVGVHRRHHAYTDIEGDPHSPVLMGYWKVQLLNLFYYRRAAKVRLSIEKYTKDLQPDFWDRNVFSRAIVGLGIGVALLIAVFGVVPGLIIAALHLVLYIGLSAAINAIGHSFGKRPFPNFATNNQWLALITFGEGLHNNHHALPTSARLADKSYQIDPGWYVIRFLSYLGLAKVRTLSKTAGT
jgi:stearoyl-CoA desaturase (delta-9 desaturase)